MLCFDRYGKVYYQLIGEQLCFVENLVIFKILLFCFRTDSTDLFRESKSGKIKTQTRNFLWITWYLFG